MQKQNVALGLCVACLATGCTINEGTGTNVGLGPVAVVSRNAAGPPETSVAAARPAEGTIAFGEPPPLVYVDPDVYVVEDIDQSVYYVDGCYWRENPGGWTRADYWDSPWVGVIESGVPDVIVHRRPADFRRYHRRNVGAWREPREHASSDRDRIHPGTHQMPATADGRHNPGPWPHANVTPLFALDSSHLAARLHDRRLPAWV